MTDGAARTSHGGELRRVGMLSQYITLALRSALSWDVVGGGVLEARSDFQLRACRPRHALSQIRRLWTYPQRYPPASSVQIAEAI
jgi:hypothetical protein